MRERRIVMGIIFFGTTAEQHPCRRKCSYAEMARVTYNVEQRQARNLALNMNEQMLPDIIVKIYSEFSDCFIKFSSEFREFVV